MFLLYYAVIQCITTLVLCLLIVTYVRSCVHTYMHAILHSLCLYIYIQYVYVSFYCYVLTESTTYICCAIYLHMCVAAYCDQNEVYVLHLQYIRLYYGNGILKNYARFMLNKLLLCYNCNYATQCSVISYSVDMLYSVA